jgi:mycoredoxin
MAALAPVVTLYTTPFCPGCFHAKVILQRFAIPYTECDVTADPDAYDDLLRLTQGRPHVPTLLMPGGEMLIEPAPLALLQRLVAMEESLTHIRRVD